MAYRAGYEIICSCGGKFIAQLCEYIFTEYDPELRDALLGGELNLVTCPSCGEGFPVENRVLYRDEKNKLWIWMCPKKEEALREDLSSEIMENNPYFLDHYLDEKDDYRKYLVFGRNALIALLLREDRDLKRTEGPRLKKNPALRMIMDDAEGGVLFLKGEKINVALPIALPPAEGPEISGPEGKTGWLDKYCRGLNIHNPFSSFLPGRMKAAWRRILEREPADEAMDEYEDFARSWAGHAAAPREFEKRCPLRARFLENAGKVKVTRKIHSMESGAVEEM